MPELAEGVMSRLILGMQLEPYKHIKRGAGTWHPKAFSVYLTSSRPRSRVAHHHS
jgi:hypothetical protein